MRDRLSPPERDAAGATLRWVELAERLRAAEARLLYALALLRCVDPELPPTVATVLSEDDAAEIVAACEEVADRLGRASALSASMRAEEVRLRLHTLQIEAEAALSAGVGEIERARLLARCLPVGVGFQALAAALRCTDCHASWRGATIGALLGSFRDADAHVVRQLTALAALSPETRWEVCDREQLTRLATVLEQHAAGGRGLRTRGAL